MQMKSSQSPTQVVEQPDQGDQAEKNVNGLLLDGSKFFGGEVKTAISSSQKILAMRGYSVSAGLVSHRLAIFAGATGDVYAIAESSSPCLIYLAKRKVAGIFPHRALHEDSDGEIHLLVCPVGMLTAELLLLRGPKLGVSNSSGSVPTYERGSKSLTSVPVSHHASRSCYSVVEKVSIPLPVSPNFIVTSMVLAYTHGVYYMFVGARSGVVALFQLSHSSSASTSNNTFQPLLIVALHNVHGKEAVTSMLWNPSEVGEASASTGYLITAGRDGSCAAHEVNLENGNHTLVHKTNLPFGPNIEALYIRNERLMVYGFRSTQFVVVDESGEEDVMTVECGGAHRNWAFNPSSPGPGGTLVWTQAGKMRICHRAERSHEVLRSGGHGREIKAIAISPRIANEQGNYTQLIATGAEDTNIKIFEYTSSGSTSKSIYKLRCLRTLRKHMTGIQHLAWSEDGRYLFSSGGREEFFIWRIRLLPIIGVGAVCEAVCESENDVADLRIMSFAVHNDGVQNETSSQDMFVISMAYSDSTIRVCLAASVLSNLSMNANLPIQIYSCTPSSPSPWLLLNTGTYLTSCITQCVFLSLRTILTSGTDGHIAFWDPSSDQLAHTSRTKIHQNSAKTLAYRVLSPSTILLVTGGDDGALGVTLIRFSTASSSHNVSTLLLPRAHAAAMTACAVVSSDHPVFDTQSVSGRPLALQLVTSGTDQRVFLWDVLIDESKPGVEGLEVKRAGRADTAVADVADLALLDLGEGTAVGVVVCGVGMEVFRVGSLRTC
jgi:WD40 repeat protein